MGKKSTKQCELAKSHLQSQQKQSTKNSNKRYTNKKPTVPVI